jgi:hypothetical protein
VDATPLRDLSRNAATQSSPISYPRLPIVRRGRIPPPASTTVARQGSKRLFRATGLFRETNDDVAVAFARPARAAELVCDLRVEPDPDRPSGPIDGGASLCGNVALIASKASAVIEIEITGY